MISAWKIVLRKRFTSERLALSVFIEILQVLRFGDRGFITWSHRLRSSDLGGEEHLLIFWAEHHTDLMKNNELYFR